ncbi:D-alanine--D-alanine ligase [Kitasatospora sp. NPDC057223]|uniref:D-alanine--D-alanine ligase family protein n=1 Tax=Kitasatospora sp. NPDC057223 TaxID=3346055 RepID=UPI00363CC33E
MSTVTSDCRNPATPPLQDLRIGVLCGGNSPERPGSLASGAAAAKGLAQAGLTGELIDVAEVPVDQFARSIDVALLALHGLGGEDGKMQGALDLYGVPYTGSGVLASATGMDKTALKTLLAAQHIDTPRWAELNPALSTAATLDMIKHSLGYPVFYKPVSGGGSLEAGVAHDQQQMTDLLERAKVHPYERYMAEPLLDGSPCTVGLIEIDGALTALPVLHVRTDREFYDYDAKHDLTLRTETCPADLPDGLTRQMQATAKRVHQLVGAHGVSRVDFMVTPGGRAAVLEINTLPGLSEHGNLATMARAAGISYPDLMVHILRSAFSKPAYLP